MLLATRVRRTTETTAEIAVVPEVRRVLQGQASVPLPGASGTLTHRLTTLYRRLNHVRSLGGDLSKVEGSPHLRDLLTAIGCGLPDQSAVAQRVEAAPFTREGERAA